MSTLAPLSKSTSQIVNMVPQDRIKDRFIKIYLLTHLTENERTAYLATFQNQIGDDLGLTWVKPQLIDWPSGQQREGSVEGGDLLRLFKQNKLADPVDARFQYFADRESVDSGTVIVAHRDAYTMLHSPQTAREITDLAAGSGITLPAEDWTKMDAVVENLMDDLTGRGVAWGRIPIRQWRLSWCNFDISNMSEDEFIEYICGGSSRILRDPDWDSDSFLEKLREEVQDKRTVGLRRQFVSVAEDDAT